MRESTLDILCCPVCKGALTLKDAKKNGKDIVSGTLVCKKCGKQYRIKDGIPDMVP